MANPYRLFLNPQIATDRDDFYYKRPKHCVYIGCLQWQQHFLLSNSHFFRMIFKKLPFEIVMIVIDKLDFYLNPELVEVFYDSWGGYSLPMSRVALMRDNYDRQYFNASNYGVMYRGKVRDCSEFISKYLELNEMSVIQLNYIKSKNERKRMKLGAFLVVQKNHLMICRWQGSKVVDLSTNSLLKKYKTIGYLSTKRGVISNSTIISDGIKYNLRMPMSYRGYRPVRKALNLPGYFFENRVYLTSRNAGQDLYSCDHRSICYKKGNQIFHYLTNNSVEICKSNVKPISVQGHNNLKGKELLDLHYKVEHKIGGKLGCLGCEAKQHYLSPIDVCDSFLKSPNFLKYDNVTQNITNFVLNSWYDKNKFKESSNSKYVKNRLRVMINQGIVIRDKIVNAKNVFSKFLIKLLSNLTEEGYSYGQVDIIKPINKVHEKIIKFKPIPTVFEEISQVVDVDPNRVKEVQQNNIVHQQNLEKAEKEMSDMADDFIIRNAPKKASKEKQLRNIFKDNMRMMGSVTFKKNNKVIVYEQPVIDTIFIPIPTPTVIKTLRKKYMNDEEIEKNRHERHDILEKNNKVAKDYIDTIIQDKKNDSQPVIKELNLTIKKPRIGPKYRKKLNTRLKNHLVFLNKKRSIKMNSIEYLIEKFKLRDTKELLDTIVTINLGYIRKRTINAHKRRRSKVVSSLTILF